MFRRDVEPRLSSLDARVRDACAERDRVSSALAAARALLGDVERTHAAAIRDVEAVASEIVLGPGARALPSNDAAIGELGPWLERLSTAAASGHTRASEIGLGRFKQAAEKLLERDLRASTRVSALRAKRDELVGRAEARTAQLTALVRRGAPVDPSAPELSRSALSVVHTRPLALADATLAVEAFERVFRSELAARRHERSTRTFGLAPCSASCPHAAATSSPRLRLTKQV